MIDAIDRKILGALLTDARMSVKRIAEIAELSAPATSERLRRLEERRVIRQYTIDIDPRALGFGLQAIVRVKPLPGKLQATHKLLSHMEEVAECDKVTGDDCFVARLHLRSIEQLDELLERVAGAAETNSAIVKTQVVARRPAPLAVERAAYRSPRSSNRMR
jgi:Lrp/AsnC family transcriptional regulator, leucine-responsive regulatory protein